MRESRVEALKLLQRSRLQAELWLLVGLAALPGCGSSGREAAAPAPTAVEATRDDATVAESPGMEATAKSSNAIMALDVKGACYRVVDCDKAGSSLMVAVSASHATVAPLLIDIRWGVDELGNPERFVDQHALGPQPETIRFGSHAPCNVLIELMLEASTKDDEFHFKQRVNKKCTGDY